MKFYFLLLVLWSCLLWSCREDVPSSKPSEAFPATFEKKENHDTTEFVIDYDTTLWTDLSSADPSIIIDLKYATNENFVKEKLYECGRCFLRPEVAQAVIAAHRQLQQKGRGLKMLDCYRPRSIQQKLWNKVPNPSYVTPPSKGSMHNRGAAVDLTLVDNEGADLNMGTQYDFFGIQAHHDHTDLPKEVLYNRRLLRETMASVGLKHIRTEWWHYSFVKKEYELSDMTWNCPRE